MNLEEIKNAISMGKKVYWKNFLYEVVLDCKNQYFVTCKSNNYSIGLTWADNVTLNGDESDFFIAE
jgi:hypothetical protein